MLHLPYHLALVLAGLGLTLLRLETGPLAALPAWTAPLALVLVVPARLAEARVETLASPRARLALAAVARATPLVVLAVALFLTDLPRLAAGLARPRSAWIDLAWLPLLLPLLLAHLGLALGRRRRAGVWHAVARPLALSWALFAWCTLGLYLVLATLVGGLPGLLAWVESTSLGSLAYTVALLGVMLTLVPRLLLLCLDTVPPAAPVRRLAEEPRFAPGGRARFRLLEWRTGDELSNAMVLAMPFGPRPVLFTDGFLGRLTRDEFEAVLAHELGHVRRRHVGTMATWVLVLALGFDLVAEAWLPLELLDGPWGVALALAFLVAMTLAVGWLSRRLELEADLAALEVTGDWRGLARVLRTYGGRRRRRATWRHFSPRERVLFLRAAARDPGVGRRLQRVLRPLGLAGRALLAVALVLTLVRGARWLPGERVWVDLRQGDARAAVERYGQLDELARADVAPGGLDRAYFEGLLDLGSALQADGSLSVAGLGQTALDLPTEAGLGRVVQLADLALLVDPHAAAALWDLRDELVARAAGEAHGPGASDLPEPWGRVRAAVSSLP